MKECNQLLQARAEQHKNDEAEQHSKCPNEVPYSVAENCPAKIMQIIPVHVTLHMQLGPAR